uniref:Homocitrate synthase n=1 Tax=Methylophaga nitratireducenticrescens TaxID=754476 RepID=I1XHS2_METNJ
MQLWLMPQIFFQSEEIKKDIDRIFSKKEKSKVSLVRVAVNSKEALNKKITILLNCLKEKGYKVALNFMQVSSVSEEYLGEIIQNVPNEYVDVIYFADSFGDMTQSKVYRVAEIIGNYWYGSIGIHAHNNKGNALSNTLTAAATTNVTWLDSTVLGMGRGAGNAPTEILLLERHKEELVNWNSESMFYLVYKYLQPLHKKYGWGHSFLFHYAAEFSIHPSYIQDLTADESYTSHEIYSALTYLTENESQKYNSDLLLSVNNQTKSDVGYGYWDPTELWKGRDVLIIGSGPSLAKYAKDIEFYIRKKTQ